MALPATWIRKNMLQSPSPNNNQDRTLTEAEIKVQRSLQKLSIPEWYLNNNSRPPKILMNDTPIQSRPPQWKKYSLNKTIASSTPSRTTTINRNGLLETEFGPPETQIFGTYRKVKRGPAKEQGTKEQTKTELVAVKRTAGSSVECTIPTKRSSRYRFVHISHTYPRMSASRKIQNINIVFTPASKSSPSCKLAKIAEEKSPADKEMDSQKATVASEIKDADLETSLLADMSLTSNSSETKSPKVPNQSLTYIKPWKSPAPCVTPEKTTSENSFELKASSTPQRSPVSEFEDSAVETSTPKQKKALPLTVSSFPVPKAVIQAKRPPPVPPRTKKLIILEEQVLCDACKADPSRRVSRRNIPRPAVGFRATTLCPIIEEHHPSTPKPRARSPVITGSPSMMSKLASRDSVSVEKAPAITDSSSKAKARAATDLPSKAKVPVATDLLKIAKASTSAESPKIAKASTSTQLPKTVKASTSTESPKIAKASTSTELPMTAKASTSTESPKIAKASTSTELPMTAKASTSTESPKIAEASTSTGFPNKATDSLRKAKAPAVTELPKVAKASAAADSPSAVFFTSKRKSTALENIVKQKERQRGGKSLVQEIIEELNEKCRVSAQPTYVTPGSKNFVKKLVKALENGKVPTPVDEKPQTPTHVDEKPKTPTHVDEKPKTPTHVDEKSETPTHVDVKPEMPTHVIKKPERSTQRISIPPVVEEDDEEVVSSDPSSEDEIKSAAVSTSISFKETDSSDSEPRSPTIRQNYNYDLNMNVRNYLNKTKTAALKAKTPEKEDESVYWIPIVKSKLPRSSSLLSMMSRLSTNIADHQSPCVSPIRKNERRMNQSFPNVWGTTYRTGENSKTLRRVNETTVLDSGYSDRSRGQTSLDNTWIDDTVVSQTASEVGSYNSLSLGSYRRRSRNNSLRRPFVM